MFAAFSSAGVNLLNFGPFWPFSCVFLGEMAQRQDFVNFGWGSEVGGLKLVVSTESL